MRTGKATRCAMRKVHLPSLTQLLAERIRGREQLLVRPGQGLPLLLITYPRGKEEIARQIESAFTHTLPAPAGTALAHYTRTLESLPVMVVVLLRPTNPCGCLGHVHPPGTESRLARRLAADLNSPVAEIDLAYEEIRKWAPRPISALATGNLGGKLPSLHFEAALLAVLLHELEHVAFPDRREAGVRTASNELYLNLMRELVRREGGQEYGISRAAPG